MSDVSALMPLKVGGEGGVGDRVAFSALHAPLSRRRPGTRDHQALRNRLWYRYAMS